ncbi:hypothetical protein DSO57_1039484, partial [Entomophthora muscae]
WHKDYTKKDWGERFKMDFFVRAQNTLENQLASMEIKQPIVLESIINCLLEEDPFLTTNSQG